MSSSFTIAAICCTACARTPVGRIISASAAETANLERYGLPIHPFYNLRLLHIYIGFSSRFNLVNGIS